MLLCPTINYLLGPCKKKPQPRTLIAKNKRTSVVLYSSINIANLQDVLFGWTGHGGWEAEQKKKSKEKKRKENMLRHKGNICPKLLVGSVQIVVVYLLIIISFGCWDGRTK
jgi:hypothetical protein